MKKINNLWGGPLGSQGSRLSYRKGSLEERRVRGSRKWQAALHGQPGMSTWPGSHRVALITHLQRCQCPAPGDCRPPTIRSLINWSSWFLRNQGWCATPGGPGRVFSGLQLVREHGVCWAGWHGQTCENGPIFCFDDCRFIWVWLQGLLNYNYFPKLESVCCWILYHDSKNLSPLFVFGDITKKAKNKKQTNEFLTI